jgi:hypothetical protein
MSRWGLRPSFPGLSPNVQRDEKKPGAPPFPRFVREGGDFDFLFVETMLGKWRFTASRFPGRFC